MEKRSNPFWKKLFFATISYPFGLAYSVFKGIADYTQSIGDYILNPFRGIYSFFSLSIGRKAGVDSQSLDELACNHDRTQSRLLYHSPKNFLEKTHNFICQSLATEKRELDDKKRFQLEDWQAICKNGMIQRHGNDEQVRDLFVGLQAKIEVILANALEHGQLQGAVGVIHTPKIATPLKKDPKGTMPEGLVADDIARDAQRLKTVTDRAKIVRQFMHAGGTLVTAHMPEILDGEQKDNYEKVCKAYPNMLRDKELTFANNSFPREFIGATYLLKDNTGKLYSFSISAYQANDEQKQAVPWGLWFGDMHTQTVAKRFNTVNEELLKPQGIDLHSLLEENIHMQQQAARGSVKGCSRG